jgi:DNA-binding beta-propeller fold protein YncE
LTAKWWRHGPLITLAGRTETVQFHTRTSNKRIKFQGEITMRHSTTAVLLALALAVATSAVSERASAQASDPNGAPNPYRMLDNWAQLPQGRELGAPIGVEIDHSDGKSLWVFERCGGKSCTGSKLSPIWKFDASGQPRANFGSGMFNFPHGLYVDTAGNVWVTDGRGEGGIGHTVIKFSPEGKVLMTLGKPGVAGDATDMFNSPSDVVIAPNGDIFVADGHGGKTNDRIVKLDKDGHFITTWGKHGSGPGEFNTPHSIALDSTGRVFVADRINSRIQIFDPNGKLLAEWKQFGRPSSVYIGKDDIIYVADSQSSDKTNPGFEQGIRIGSAKDGKVMAFIPLTDPALGSAEEVAADDQGNIFAGFTDKRLLRKFVKN